MQLVLLLCSAEAIFKICRPQGSKVRDESVTFTPEQWFSTVIEGVIPTC